ncbi:hypothetical protein D3C87_1950590 [compost metagenome]
MKRLMSLPTALRVLPALALVPAISLPIFSTASAARPIRAIRGASSWLALALFFITLAASFRPASMLSLRSARVCATRAMSVRVLWKAA